MPDTNAPAPARPTLTQRRTMGPLTTSVPKMEEKSTVPGAMPSTPSLERPMRMMPTGGSRPTVVGTMNSARGTTVPATEEKGSPAKIVLWVVLVIAIAVASYFAIRNNIGGDTGTVTPTATVTPVVTEMPRLISDTVLLDSEATNTVLDSAYNADAQVSGTQSTAKFSIDAFNGAKYETFTRFAFQVSRVEGAETVTSPYVTASYDPDTMTITLNFKGTVTKSGVIELDDQIPVDSNAISLLTRKTAALEGDDAYVIELKENTSYALHLVTTDIPTVILDVKETAAPSPTATPVVTTTVAPSVSPSVTVTTTPKITATLTPTPIVGSNILENSYSQTAQTLTNGLTTNTADMICKDKCLYWIETATAFTFDKPIDLGDGDKYPSVSATLEGTKLKVVVSNLVTKSATSSMSFSGSKLVKSLDATRSGNTLTYEFTLNSAKDYRILFTKSDYLSNADVLRVQVKP